MIEKNTNTIPATGGSASRTLKVERSVYGPDRVFLGTRDDLDGRQIGAHLIPSEARELVEALKPYADPFVPATVIDEDGDAWVEQEGGLFLMIGSVGRTATLAEIEESYGIDDGSKPEIDAIGAQVYVTGDGEKWEHGFEPGTLVTVADDDYLLDGSYEVRDESGRGDYVGASDLSLEAPLQAGDTVRVSEDYTHFLTDGSTAEIVSGGPFVFTVRALEPLKDGRPAGTTQYVNADVLTKTEPLAEWEKELLGMAEEFAKVTATPEFPFPKVVLGIDPSVKDWSEIMKDSIMTIPEPVEIREIEPEPIVPALEVGDRVQVIDATGTAEARLSDKATVTHVKTSLGHLGSRGPLTTVQTDDGRTYSMFAARFEKVIPTWKPQAGDRVALVEEKGDGSSPAKVGDLGTVESLQEDGGLDGDLLFVRMDDGHSTARFASRWEKSDAPLPCDLCGPECVTGSPVRRHPETGYFVPASSLL
jgi:hypothetical protein